MYNQPDELSVTDMPRLQFADFSLDEPVILWRSNPISSRSIVILAIGRD